MTDPESDADRFDTPEAKGRDGTGRDIAPEAADGDRTAAPKARNGDHADTDEWVRVSRRLRAVAETSDDAVYAVDGSGRIRYANGRYAALRGADRDALVGTQIDRWASPELVDRIDRELDATPEGDPGVQTLECWLSRADGSSFPARLRISEFPERGEAGGRVVAVEERAEASEREREHGRLDGFAGAVAHDIRNSLNLAKGRLELADAACDSEHLDAVGAALVRMEDIVDDALWLAREEATIDDPAAVSLRDTVENAWRTATAEDDAATLRMEADDLADTVAADRTQFQRLLENVFANAVDHGGDGVTVTVGWTEDGLYVADDGPGVPPAVRDAAFDPGYSTADGGTGLGLAIVGRIAAAHGWEVAFADGATGGARLEVTGVEERDDPAVGAGS